MKRRKLLKSIGTLGIIGLGGSYLSSCCDNDTKASTIEPKKEESSTSSKNRQLMKIQNPEKPTGLELKHTPEISLGDKDEKGFTKAEITVGSKGIIHPTKVDHWIDYIKLLKDDQLVGEIKIEPGMARGFNAFRVNLDGAKSLKAIIGCNIHGVWENAIKL